MTTPLDFTCDLTRITRGFDRQTCWTHARGGVIPSPTGPVAVVTMQKLLLSGSDIFEQLHETRSHDRGQSWSPLTPIPTLTRWKEEGGVEGIMCDATPRWHAVTKTTLLTGHVARYVGEDLLPWPRACETIYAVHDGQAWSRPRFLEMPDKNTYFASGSGSGERYDLPDGDILLPIYYAPLAPTQPRYSATVARCGFDGQTMVVKQMGSAHSVNIGRGLCEPSITHFQDRYFLTLRNDEAGYVTSSPDGLQFEHPRMWCFDDGSPLGNYNTQQHWLTHSDALFLVYTRRGLNNDHIFRHRAPLVIAQVDPDRLVILRDTERVIVPERGARLGNFSVVPVDANESWVIAAEWMQNNGLKSNPNICTQYGSDNSVWLARLIWNRPNRTLA